jgi:hypothetical protein
MAWFKCAALQDAPYPGMQMVPPEVQVIYAHTFFEATVGYLSSCLCNVCPTNSPGGDTLLSQAPRFDGSCTAHVTDCSEERQHDLESVLESV